MKVKIAFTLDIDPECWTTEYGVEGISEIRHDVQQYVEHGVRADLAEKGVLKS
jgi:hypothetical protein